MLKNITVSCSPHISKSLSTQKVMIDVIIGLTPAIAAAAYFFRINALIVLASCVISCVATEYVCNLIQKKQNSIGDFSAIVTGIILALSLPPKLPFWVAIIGSAFAITIGKMVFGGLGANIFNPAMAGRAFLTASFGIMMTTWTLPATIDSTMPEISATSKSTDVRTQATPLAWSKKAVKDEGETTFENKQLKTVFIGEVGGCLGETSAIAILFGGVYLLIRKTITYHIPLAVLASALVFGGIYHVINPDAYTSPVFYLGSGGLMLCAFFIATDPVTAPLTTKGMWIFGAGLGMLIMLIRIVGEYPEGVMFAILLMNAITPLIDRFCKQIPAGGKPNV